MEYSNLEKENKIQNILQKTINEVDTNASYSQNYEYFQKNICGYTKIENDRTKFSIQSIKDPNN